jgi:hypothetical protein
MRRRALLALFGTTATATMSGCLGEDLNTVEYRIIATPDWDVHLDSRYECDASHWDVVEICRPITTHHQTSQDQHRQFVDRFGEIRYMIRVQIPSGHPQGPDVRVHRTLSREVYNQVTIGDKIVEKGHGEIGGDTVVTSIELRQTGDRVDVECPNR